MSLILTNINAQKISFVYNISQPNIKNIKNYQLLEYPNSQQYAKTGNPSIPYLSTKLLLPEGTSAESIKYIFEDKTKLNGNFKLYPMQQVSPISLGSDGVFRINNNTYQQTKYPTTQFGDLSTQFMNGYGIALSKFTPIEYNPSTGEVFYYKKVTAIVSYTSTKKAQNATTNISSRPEVIKKVANFVQNPNLIKNYHSRKSTDTYEMLIITTDTYQNNFDSLINFHLNRGTETHLVTLSEIENSMSGVDTPEKMRNYIIQEYQNHDIQYVLLGGDADVVPFRGLYCEALSGGSTYSDDIPADVYFSALDGTWNDDGDSHWGEPDEDDLLPDIAVGRLPFSTASELSAISHKIISYSNNPVTSTNELNNPLLAGESLWDDPATYGSDYLNLLIGYHTDNGYTTNGIPANSTYTTMYASDTTWTGSGSAIMAAMNSGHSFVHHVGHANTGTMMGLYTSDITDTNFFQLNGVTHNYALVYSHGCICGAFDADDCISETMVTINNCAVGVFTNSRYGWFNEGQTEGPSAHLHREFVDAIYNDHQCNAGVAEMISKQQTAPWVENPDEYEPGAQRWVFYDHNVLTDPALPIWTSNPFDISTSYDNILPFGANYTVTVSSAKAPLEGYKCSILQNSHIVGSTYTNSSGQATINVDFQQAVIGAAVLIVTGQNILPHQYNISIEEGTNAVLSMTSCLFIDDNNNQPDNNETLGLNLKIKNFGQQAATNVQLKLTTTDSNITIITGTQNISEIAALDSAISNNILQIKTANTDDQYTCNLSLEITSEQFNVTRTIPVTINAPEITYNSLIITELSGDNDGIIEPGETGRITFNFSNTGHAVTPDILGILSSTDANISLTTTSINIGLIQNDSSFTISSDFTLSSNANIGDIVNFKCSAKASPYSKSVDVSVYVGDATEDFETADFSKFNWIAEGDANWFVQDSTIHQGSYSAKNGNIDDDQKSSLKIEINILNDDSISFYKKVSSEKDWDYLHFFIDGQEIAKWSGEIDWSQENFAVTAGQHTFEWTYTKDGSLSDGNDCAWIDDIVFPPFGTTNITTKISTFTQNTTDLKVYPTLFTNYVNFSFSAKENQQYRVEIYDLAGKKIFGKTDETSSKENIFIWNAPENLQNGMYFYRLFIDNQMFSGKIIKN